MKLNALRCCVAKREAELTLDVFLKGLVRRPLRRTRVLSVLLPVTLLLLDGNRALKTMKVIPMLVAIMVVVGTLVSKKIAYVMAKVGAVLILGKIS